MESARLEIEPPGGRLYSPLSRRSRLADGLRVAETALGQGVEEKSRVVVGLARPTLQARNRGAQLR